MTTKLQHVTDDDFKQRILDAKGVALVDFWAPWCAPCRALGPVIEGLADELGDAVTVAKLNVDDSPITAQQYGIASIPTVLLLRDGEVVRKFVGVQRGAVYAEAIRALQPAAV